MMINNSFYRDLQRGKQAEVMVANAFREMDYDVFDISDDPK